MSEDDAKLIARVAGGDLGHPLEELYDRYAARLHGLGLRLLGDPEDDALARRMEDGARATEAQWGATTR